MSRMSCKKSQDIELTNLKGFVDMARNLGFDEIEIRKLEELYTSGSGKGSLRQFDDGGQAGE